MNVFDIAATKNTSFFISYYAFVNWMGVWIFTSYPDTQINLLLWGSVFYWGGWLVDLAWAFLLQSKQTTQDLGTSPSFFLRERKNKMSWKAGHVFTAKYMSPAAKESSPEVGFETVPQVSPTANILWKCEQNIPTMMSAIMEHHGRKVSRYHSNALNWTKTYGKTFDIKTRVTSECFTQFCILIESCLFHLSCCRSANLFQNAGILLQASPSKLLSQGTALVLFFKTIITFIPSWQVNLKDSSWR